MGFSSRKEPSEGVGGGAGPKRPGGQSVGRGEVWGWVVLGDQAQKGLRPALGKLREGMVWTGERRYEQDKAGLSWLGLGYLARPTGLLPRCQPVFLQVQECLNQFKVTSTQLRQIQASLLRSMEQALTGQASPAPAVRMLPTYVESTPHGTGG